MSASNTNIEKLLNAYADRELSAVEEEQLFAELANNDELRTELKQIQALRSETRNYLSSLTPPAAVTAGVFGTLGFSTSTAQAAAAAAAKTAAGTSATTTAGTTLGTSAGFIATVQSLWIPITAAVITAAVTTVTLFTVLHNTEQESTPQSPQQEIQQTTVPVQPTTVPDVSESNENNDAVSSATAPGLPSVQSTSATSGAAGSELAQETSTANTASDVHASVQNNASDASSSSPATLSTKSAMSSAATVPATAASSKTIRNDVRTTTTPAESSNESNPASSVNELAFADPASVPAAKATTNISASRQSERMPVSAQDKVFDFDAIQIPIFPVYRPAMAIIPGVAADINNPYIDDELLLPFHEPVSKPIFALAVRGFSAQSYPGNDVASNPKPFYNDMSLGAYYYISENDLVGIDVGHEAFAQNYNGIIDRIDRNGNPRSEDRLVYQTLLSTWATANYRHRFGPLFGSEIVRPYFSAGAGWTGEFWPLTRGSLGIGINPIGNVEMLVALEGSLLMYPFQSTWFSTKKLGITYGLMIGF